MAHTLLILPAVQFALSRLTARVCQGIIQEGARRCVQDTQKYQHHQSFSNQRRASHQRRFTIYHSHNRLTSTPTSPKMPRVEITTSQPIESTKAASAPRLPATSVGDHHSTSLHRHELTTTSSASSTPTLSSLLGDTTPMTMLTSTTSRANMHSTTSLVPTSTHAISQSASSTSTQYFSSLSGNTTKYLIETGAICGMVSALLIILALISGAIYLCCCQDKHGRRDVDLRSKWSRHGRGDMESERYSGGY